MQIKNAFNGHFNYNLCVLSIAYKCEKLIDEKKFS